MAQSRLLTRAELAAALGVGRAAVAKWRRQGCPTAGRRGRDLVYELAAVQAWRRERFAQAAPNGRIPAGLELAASELEERAAAAASEAPTGDDAAAALPPAAARLAELIAEADSTTALDAVVRAVMTALARGEISPALEKRLHPWVDARRKLLSQRERANSGAQVLSGALHVLTEEELELVRAHRRSLAGPPLAPGEDVDPPPRTEP